MMKKLILLLLLLTVSSAVIAQDRLTKEERIENVVYRHFYDVVFKNTYIFAFRVGSKYLNDSIYKSRTECDLKDGEGKKLKKNIVAALKRHDTIFTKKMAPFPSFVVVAVPTSDGQIQECFLRWNGDDLFLNPAEVTAILDEVEKMSVAYEDISSKTFCFCWELTFGILDKDWDYILGRDR